jgi:hypothetical protein
MIELVHIHPIDFQVGDIVLYHTRVIDYDLFYEKNILLGCENSVLILSKTLKNWKYRRSSINIECLWTYAFGKLCFRSISTESFDPQEDFIKINYV